MPVLVDPRDYTDRYLRAFRTVPPAGRGICDVCHSGPGPGFTRCLSCSRTLGAMWHSPPLVVPITLYEVSDQVHTLLRGYKDSPNARARADFATTVAATLAVFAHGHVDCIRRTVGAAHTLVTTVPSSSGRGGQHPLEVAVSHVPLLARRQRRVLEWSANIALDHAQTADPRAYTSDPCVRGEHVLLIDDTFTSGTRTFSACASLRGAGAASVSILVVGRVISPGWNAQCAAIWAAATANSFSFDTCCLEP